MPDTGTKQAREAADEAVDSQPAAKKACPYSPEILRLVRSDQVALLLAIEPSAWWLAMSLQSVNLDVCDYRKV